MNFKNLIYRIRRKFGLSTQEQFQDYLRQYGVLIGDKCRIFSDIHTNESFLITIGHHTTISSNVTLLTHDNSVCKLFPDKYSDYFGRITIGNYCFIGANSTIMPGVTLGDKTIVGAGSIVTKSYPPQVVLAGVPARILCSVDEFASRVEKYCINIEGLSYEERVKLLTNSNKLIVK